MDGPNKQRKLNKILSDLTLNERISLIEAYMTYLLRVKDEQEKLAKTLDDMCTDYSCGMWCDWCDKPWPCKCIGFKND